MDIVAEIRAAEKRIRPYVRRTFLEPSPYFSAKSGANVFFKCENLQHTGSFKVRGATNKLLSLSKWERAMGVVAASTGNHGAAVAFALGRLGANGIVYVPEIADPEKVDAIRRLRAEVRTFGHDAVEAEAHAREYARENRLTYLSPYNDPHVVGGQGTIGIEIADQIGSVDGVFVALGGGGLISGVAAYLKSRRPDVEVIGCSPENSQVMIQSVAAGRILDLPSLPTLSDGTAGGVEAGAITFELCRQLVDAYEVVSERAIAENLRQFISIHHMLIEGAAAVPLAAFMKQCGRFVGKNVVIVLCGANIGMATLEEVLTL